MGGYARRIERIWYSTDRPPWWLRVLVLVYRALRALHQMPYVVGWRRAYRAPVPVIVVGNLTVGGSGKTPLVIALVEALRGAGFKPGVVSRGYGGSARGPLLLDASTTPERCGDEPCLVARRTGVPVVIGRDRAAAARRIVACAVDVVVADDGLQNPSLARDVEICVIDGTRRFGNGLLLPAGPLREPAARLATIDFRVCNGGEPRDGEYPMRLVGDVAVALDGSSRTRPLADFAAERVHAVAGIGNPERFFANLRAHGIDVVPHPFLDHHVFSGTDFAFGDDLPVLMTEKDAIKCEEFVDPRLWRVPVRAKLPDALFSAVVVKVQGSASLGPHEVTKGA